MGLVRPLSSWLAAISSVSVIAAAAVAAFDGVTRRRDATADTFERECGTDCCNKGRE